MTNGHEEDYLRVMNTTGWLTDVDKLLYGSLVKILSQALLKLRKRKSFAYVRNESQHWSDRRSVNWISAKRGLIEKNLIVIKFNATTRVISTRRLHWMKARVSFALIISRGRDTADVAGLKSLFSAAERKLRNQKQIFCRIVRGSSTLPGCFCDWVARRHHAGQLKTIETLSRLDFVTELN